jgi:hypothetical protein
LKAILRDLGLPRKLERYTVSRDPIWLYRLLALLIHLAGYQSWLLLLDEVELVGKTGIGTRARAYANLDRLTASDALPHVMAVWAVASNFYPDVLDGKQDREKASEWLATRGRVDDAAAARRAIDHLASADLLPALTAEQVATLVASLRETHEAAYEWTAPPLEDLLEAVGRHAPGADAKLRTKIRIAIQWLDVWLQYDRAPTVSVWRIGEMDLTEEPTDAGTDPEDPEDAPVRRARIF